MEKDIEFNIITTETKSDINLFIKLNKEYISNTNTILKDVSFMNDDLTFNWVKDKINLIDLFIKNFTYVLHKKTDSFNIPIGKVDCSYINLELLFRENFDIDVYLEILSNSLPPTLFETLSTLSEYDLCNHGENLLIINNI